MKKKIVSLFLIIALLCATVVFTACEDENDSAKTDAEIINEAIEKTGALNEISASMKMDFTMEAEGVSLTFPISAQIKGKNLDSDDDMIYSMKMSMSMMGQKMDMEMYQEGQWAYMVMNGEKYKTKTADIEESNYSADTQAMLEGLPEEALKDVKLEKNDDGSQTAKFTIPGEKFDDAYKKAFDSFMGAGGMGAAMPEMEMPDVNVALTLENGYVTEYDMSFAIEMDIEGTKVSADVKVELTYENPGEPVTITPPEGYEDFEVVGSQYI